MRDRPAKGWKSSGEGVDIFQSSHWRAIAILNLELVS
jgi:hypothetical protein